jgi:signal transduction histidine kinase/ligand-binding sensor domain-containing protein/DNA-binding response OmpR family regulator
MDSAALYITLRGRYSLLGKSVRIFLKRKVFIAVFFICFSGIAVASLNPGKYSNAIFKSLTINEGLSQNFVAAIAQDNLGFMWIGTKDGLNMYDGYRFKVFKHDPFDTFSISDNFVKVIYCDRKGRIWIGTLNGGLNVFDRHSGRFFHFTHNPGDERSLSSNNVQAIVEDINGDIWVGTNTSGLNRLRINDQDAFPDPENVSISRIKQTIEGFSIENVAILSLISDSKNTLWIGTDQLILAADVSNEEPVYRQVSCGTTARSKYITDYPVESESAGRSIFEDEDGEIWMFNRFGLYKYHPDQQLFVKFRLADPDYNLFRCLAATTFSYKGQKEIWISKEDRLVIMNALTGGISEIMHDRSRTDGLQRGHLITLFTDRGGTMWIGSNGYGISLFDPYASKFGYPSDFYRAPDGSVISCRDLSIRSFYKSEGNDKSLWIGSNSGFFRVNRNTGELKPVTTANGSINDEGLIVYSIAGDKDGTLWLGSSWGLISYDPKTNFSKVYHTGLEDSPETFDTRISKVYVRDEQIWVLTANSIALFDRDSGTFEHTRYNNDPVNRFKEQVYPCLYEDPEGNFWLGTPNGLQHFIVKTRQLQAYVNDPGNPESLGFNDVRAIVADPFQPEKYLWMATGGGGFSRFDIASQTFRNFTEKEGLSNNMVYGLLVDDLGFLWMSTNNGLSRFDINTESFTNYVVSDGLQSNEFNSGAFYKSKNGELFFGGIKGYNHFSPAELEHKQYHSPVVFTAFNLLHEAKKDLLKKLSDDFLNTSQISLPYNLNYFNIEFSSLDYSSSSKKEYAYSFTQKGEQWIDLNDNRYISFTDVKPGTYTLRVKGTNSDGVWSNHEAVMSITITRPWWTRNWAYAIYFILILLAAIAIRKYELSRIMLRNRIRIADFEAQKQKEVNLMKSQFFANISHEFRTPLTMIKGPIEQMIDKSDDKEQKQVLRVMHKNADNLLNLINQLLDLSKLENRQYTISVAPGDIVSYLNGLVMSFSSLTQQKQIELSFNGDPAVSSDLIKNNFYFDRDAMQKIINNLVSNAVKFTPSHGRIDVGVTLQNNDFNGQAVEIVVSDTGIGIPQEKIPFIYDRFFQVDSSAGKSYEGWGVGLAYVKELMDAHKATISVESQPGKGTAFKLRFPVGRGHYDDDQIVVDHDKAQVDNLQHTDLFEDAVYPLKNTTLSPSGDSADKPVVLVVEDHTDVRRFVCDGMKDEYVVLEAAHAADGLKLANDNIPDLIISDVMMPGMDGFEFCEQIKTSEKTSHVPVILLTARASDEDKIQGLETGADDYLTKPFNTKELLLRVRNLIENRRLLREKFLSNTVIAPAQISVSSRDRQFMEKLLRVVETNINNERFGVEDLAAGSAMSQAQLHRKLKALVNQSANQFIRSVRMHRAKELLEKDAGNIAEIAYMVGYGDPGYFTRTYRTFFGILPSDVRKHC